MEKFDDKSILSFAESCGMVDLHLVEQLLEMNQRKEYLNNHPYQVWIGSDGKWATYLPDEKTGKRVQRKRNSQKEIEDVIVNYWKDKDNNPTIRQVFDEWNDRRMELGKIAKSTHLRNQQVFNRHYSSFGERKIGTLTEQDFSDFLEMQITEHDLTAKGFANLKGITKGYLKRAKKLGYISFNVENMLEDMDVTDRDFKKKIKEDYEEVFSEDEMPVVINYLRDHIDNQRCLCLYLMFISGIRVGEAVTLKHSDFHEKSFDIRRTETRYKDHSGYVYDVKEFPKSKAGVRTVAIPESQTWILKYIRTSNPFGEYVFEDDSGRFHSEAMRRKIKKICNRLDIYPKSPHKIRKTYGSILLDNGIDNSMIIQQMGHTNIGTTEQHYHRNRRNIDRKVEILSAIGDFR